MAQLTALLCIVCMCVCVCACTLSNPKIIDDIITSQRTQHASCQLPAAMCVIDLGVPLVAKLNVSARVVLIRALRGAWLADWKVANCMALNDDDATRCRRALSDTKNARAKRLCTN